MIALHRDHRECVPTSKGAAISDHVWVSPELAATLVKVEVLDEVFAEHDVVVASFQLPVAKTQQSYWHRPAAFPWTAMPKLDFHTHPSRHGEETMRSDLLNRSVHCWFKQLRRLQAFAQRAKNVQQKPHLQVAQACTWRNVLHARGFRGGFASWWPQRLHQLSGSPLHIPSFPPSAEIAWAIFVDFRANFRHYEQWQLRRRKQLIQTKAFDYNRLLFRQLKDVDMTPPAHFELRNTALIACVEGDKAELSEEVTLPAHAKWTLNDEPVELELISSTMVKVDTDRILLPGQRLDGLLVVTSFQEMDSALTSLWKPIWNKHSDLPPDAWNRALQFAQVYMPQMDFEVPLWSGERICNLATRYKKKASTGPDGWSREDVQHLSSSAQDDLALLFTEVQKKGLWPQQLVTGMVCPARKHQEAKSPGDYRPIILLSFLYRLWSSVASKALLGALASRVGTHIYGYVPGRRPQDLWFVVQMLVECSYFDNDLMTGFNLDLEKCFNCLPRMPILGALTAMKAPAEVLVPWKGALQQLQRRFKIASNTGQAHCSSVGFPEGDALSCAAMLTYNMLMDAYLMKFEPTCILTSFVDNVQLIAPTAADMQRGLLTTLAFLDMMGMRLDRKKCFAWSTQTSERKLLRSLGHTVRLHAKDLGASMAFSRILNASTSEERIHSISHFWPILQRSCAPVWFKLQAIKMSAWPKALHACENRKVSLTTTATLRTKAMQAMGWRRAGATPWVRWTILQSIDLDPEFHQIWSILRSFHRLASTLPLVRDSWASFLEHPLKHGQGPFHSLHLVLELSGWTWLGDLTLLVGAWVFPWHLLHEALLRRLVEYSWDDFVVRQIQHRQDFHGLSSISRRLSTHCLGLSLADQALLHTIQDGTFYTAWQKGKFDPTLPSFCDHCEVEDDLAHRCTSCPKYRSIHQQFPECVEAWPLNTPAFNMHGLMERNEHTVHWMTYLIDLPDGTKQYAYHPIMDELYDLFVDGSCDKIADVSYAAWAVFDHTNARILAQSPLHGLIQTINRAELTAVLSAMQWKLHARCHVRVWTDSDYVFKNWWHLWRSRSIPHHWSNQDLWGQMLSLIEAIHWDRCSLHKVRSHGDLDSSTDPVDDWAFLGNQYADLAAKRSNRDRGHEFQHLLLSLSRADECAIRKGSLHRQFLLAIAHFDLDRSLPEARMDLDELPLSLALSPQEFNDCWLAAALEPCLHLTTSLHRGSLTISSEMICELVSL